MRIFTPKWSVARIFGTASSKLTSTRWTTKKGIGNAGIGLLGDSFHRTHPLWPQNEGIVVVPLFVSFFEFSTYPQESITKKISSKLCLVRGQLLHLFVRFSPEKGAGAAPVKISSRFCSQFRRCPSRFALSRIRH